MAKTRREEQQSGTGAGYVKEWLADRSILCYRFLNTERATMDAWAEDVTREMTCWTAGYEWRAMLDLRHGRAVVSAYANHRVREAARLRPDVSGKTALLVPDPVTARIASLVIHTLPNAHRRRLVFEREAEAVAWLLGNDTITSG